MNDNRCSTDIIRSLFLDQLPFQQRAILVASQIDDLPTLASMADRISETVELTTVKAVSSQVEDIQTSNLEKKIDSLIARIALIENHSKSYRPSRSSDRSRSKSRERSRSRSRKPGERCY